MHEVQLVGNLMIDFDLYLNGRESKCAFALVFKRSRQ